MIPSPKVNKTEAAINITPWTFSLLSSNALIDLIPSLEIICKTTFPIIEVIPTRAMKANIPAFRYIILISFDL